MKITILHEAWRADPLAWIHRAEARSIAAELRRAGREVSLASLGGISLSTHVPGPLLLRVSDPVMLATTQSLARLGISYLGPSASVMERCYDKYQAQQIALANGVDCPATVLASETSVTRFPLVLKPRRGSDSVGLRILKKGPIPQQFHTDSYIMQHYIHGDEVTVAMFRDQVAMPLRVVLPDETPYTFLRKYILRPAREVIRDTNLVERARRAAQATSEIFGVDWAGRVDFIYERATGRLCFLECDAAPLVGARSAFAASFTAAGISRAEQLRMLLSRAPEKL